VNIPIEVVTENRMSRRSAVTDVHASVPVAVITPAFNAEATIANTIRSVLRQTHQSFTYVIVDNGSTDATIEVAAQASGGDPRVTLMSEPQRGSGPARNRGVAATTEPFVAFVDADDEWDPYFLSRLLLQLNQSGPRCAAAFCGSQVVTPAGKSLGFHRPTPRTYNQRRLLTNGCPPGNGSSLMIRRSALEHIGGFRTDIASCVDFDAWLRMTATGDTFACVSDVLVKHRFGVPNCISSNITARITMLLQLIDEHGVDLLPAERRLALLYPTEVAVVHGDPRAYELLKRCRPWNSPVPSSPSWRRLVRHVGSNAMHSALRSVGAPAIDRHMAQSFGSSS
jgi:glycosyltransferase involved in cell wall biosynthesis